jgi:hypothetical protein
MQLLPQQLWHNTGTARARHDFSDKGAGAWFHFRRTTMRMNGDRMRSKQRNRQLLQAAACGLALFGLLAGCSEEQKDEGKGVVERASEEVAHKAAEQLTKPINKAKDSQALQNAQNQRLEEMTEQAQQ